MVAVSLRWVRGRGEPWARCRALPKPHCPGGHGALRSGLCLAGLVLSAQARSLSLPGPGRSCSSDPSAIFRGDLDSLFSPRAEKGPCGRGVGRGRRERGAAMSRPQTRAEPSPREKAQQAHCFICCGEQGTARESPGLHLVARTAV